MQCLCGKKYQAHNSEQGCIAQVYPAEVEVLLNQFFSSLLEGGRVKKDHIKPGRLKQLMLLGFVGLIGAMPLVLLEVYPTLRKIQALSLKQV